MSVERVLAMKMMGQAGVIELKAGTCCPLYIRSNQEVVLDGLVLQNALAVSRFCIVPCVDLQVLAVLDTCQSSSVIATHRGGRKKGQPGPAEPSVETPHVLYVGHDPCSSS